MGQLDQDRIGRRDGEEAELLGVARVGRALASRFELGEQRLGSRDDGIGQAGQARDLDAVAPVGAARPHLVQEDDLVVPLAYGDVEVSDGRQPIGQLGQLVEVRREEHLASGALVQRLDDGPRDGEAVERRCPATDLVEEHEAPRRDVVEDGRRLHHLDEERALAAPEVVLGADPCEQAIDEAQARLASRNEGAHLGEDHQVARLAQVDRFPRHVRSSEDDNPCLGVEREVVGRDRLRRARLQHGMAAVHDLDAIARVDDGPHMAAKVRDLGEAEHHVEPGQRARRRQQRPGFGGYATPDVLEQLVLEPPAALLGAEHLSLVLLQLRRDVALGSRERLAAHVFRGNSGGLSVADLDAVAEDAIEADPERREAGARALALLEAGDPLARLARVLDQRRERVTPALAYEPALVQDERRLVDQRPLEQSEKRVERCDLVTRGRQQQRGGLAQMRADLRERLKARAQPDQIAGVSDTERGAARQALEVAHVREQPAQLGARGRGVDQRLDGILAGGDGAEVEERPQQPLAQQPRAHRGRRFVQHAEERHPRIAVTRVDQLERLHGRGVEGHRLVAGQPREPREMPERFALSRPDIGERRSGGLEADRHVRDAERRERGQAEVSAEVAHRAPERERRRIPERERRARRLESRHEMTGLARRLRHQDLARPPHQRRRQHVLGVAGVLPRPEIAGGHVEQRDAGALARAHDREQEVVGGTGEERGVGDRSRRDEPHDVTLEEFLALAGGLELLAERDLLAGADQPRDIDLGGVMRDARHRRALPRRQRDLQQPGAELGILEEQLVEIAEAEQQQVVRVALLEVPVLTHHRRDAAGPSSRISHPGVP